MRLALRELRRTRRRFLPTTAALSLLVVLLLVLGGLLDGLYIGSTGALRAQESDLVVFDKAARESSLRSRIEPSTRATIEDVDGVEATYGFGVALVGADVPGASEIADAAVIGYEGNVDGVPAPPAPGKAWADRSLEVRGVEEGAVVRVGPTRIPLEVVGWVEDTNYLQQGGLWAEPDTWREVLAESRPGAAVGDDVFQNVWVAVADGADPGAVAAAIDDATGTTETLTRDDAVLALPGIREQNTIFTQIIGVTFLVAGLVVALFFALLTLERTPMLGVLKAIGASSSQLVGTLLTQTLVVTAIAYAIGGVIAFGLDALIPPDVPIIVTGSRAVFVAVGVFVAAVIGGAISLRRIVRIDPASAIGTGT
jgi:putative ABC transport system permease protein